MSDDTNAQSSPSWTPPPPAGSNPPDSTGSTPSPRSRSTRVGLNINPPIVVGLLGVVGLVLAIFLKEAGTNLWDALSEAWAIFAIVAAVLALVPSFGSALSLRQRVAWQIGAASVGALLLWWVLFILPNIARNTSFLATLAIAALAIGVWLSPGNTLDDSSSDVAS